MEQSISSKAKPKSGNRQCGRCDLCCKGWISSTVNGVRLGPLNPCVHSKGNGCAIYADRPEVPCASFKCGWLVEDSPLPDHLQPNKSGAIVLLNRQWENQDAIFALPTGERVPQDTLKWLMAYSRKHSIPLMYFENVIENGALVEQKQFGYGPPAFIHAVKTCIVPDDVFL